MGGHVRTQKVSVSEGHSPPGERRMDRQVWGVERIRGSKGHSQHRTDGQVSGMERIRGSEGHLLPGECRRRGKSGHGENPTKQRVLTNWREGKEDGLYILDAYEHVLGLGSVADGGVRNVDRSWLW